MNRSGAVTIRNFVRSGMPRLSIAYRAGRAGIVAVELDRMGLRRGPAHTLVRFIIGNRNAFQTTFPPTPNGSEIQQFVVRFIATVTKQPLPAVVLIGRPTSGRVPSFQLGQRFPFRR